MLLVQKRQSRQGVRQYIDWINCDLFEDEWFHGNCARIPVSSDDDTVTGYPCTECARSNLHTTELKLFITESITTNIAEPKSRSLRTLESGPNPR
jgi:hypothetical protein